MRNRFQYHIATGRLTLPVAIVLSVILWIIGFNDKMEAVSFLIGGLVTYLLVEQNTSFAFIRSRSSLPSALFAVLYSASLFLHEYGKGECWILLLFMGSLYCLLRSYESKNASAYIFHAFLWLAIASLIKPGIILSAPLLFITMSQLRAFSIRTFFAGIIGLCTPYWVITGYEIYSGNSLMISTWFDNILKWNIDEYRNIPLQHLITTGCILLLSAVSGIYSIITSQSDKVKNRIIISAINTIGIYETVLIMAQPVMLKSVLPIIITMCALLHGYIMIQKGNRFTYIFMIVSFVVTALMAVYNIMSHFAFNFGF